MAERQGDDVRTTAELDRIEAAVREVLAAIARLKGE